MKEKVLNVLLVIIGNFIVACAVSCFIIPNNILSGGLAGIAVGLQPIFPFIDVTMFISISTVVLFILGAITLGKEFFLNTLVSAACYPIWLNIMKYIMQDRILTSSPILASIYTGILVGIGIGLVFRTGSSTGGVDIVALITEKYLHIPLHIMMLIIDGCTVLLGITTYSIEAAMIGLISVYISSIFIDKTLSFGGQKTKSIIIVTNKYEEILKEILVDVDRGATLIHSEGGYSREFRYVIMCVIENKQYPKLNALINEIDPNAFIVVQDAQEVRGNGFTYYTELRRKALKK